LQFAQHFNLDPNDKIVSYFLFKRKDGGTPTTLRGTKWKLTGMVNTQTGGVKELEPKNCDECYTLTFWGDFVISSRSIWAYLGLNLLRLDLEIDPAKPWGWEGSPLHAEEWRQEWIDDSGVWQIIADTYEDSYLFRCGIASTESYEITTDELKLFFVYQEQKFYLLFKLVYK
jgi:hypothetical protein